LTIDRANGAPDGAARFPSAGRERLRLPGGRRAGAHLPMALGLVRVVERTAEIGASAVQIFSDNPTSWRRRPETPPEAPAFRRRLVELDIGPVAIHAPYLVNLAGPDNEFFERSVGLMRHELAAAPEYSARFVNVHVGSHRGSGLEAGVRRLVDGLERVTDGLPAGVDDGRAPLVVLENSSGGGFAIGASLEELTIVLDAAAARGLDERLAICLDAAHLWGAGYDISKPEAIDGLLDDFDRLIGLDRLVMIHLNDTHSARGSRHDRHANLGEGLIGREGLAHLLTHPSLDHVTFYLETPGMEDGYDAVNVARLGDLAAGRPLTPGPAARPAAVAGGTVTATRRATGATTRPVEDSPRPARARRSGGDGATAGGDPS
jgi:deoxyribonuclease IV